MALRRIMGCTAAVLLAASPVAQAAEPPEANFWHGVSQVVQGVLLELPKTVVHTTMHEPPVVGTLMGLLAGTARALQVTVGGVVEMAAGFDPWGGKR